jgi:hypothetical protein
MQINNKIGGFFRLEAAKIVDGKEISRRVVADWFPNLITNAGLDRLSGVGSVFGWEHFRYCVVGSSNTTPQFTDTTIGSVVAAEDGGVALNSLQAITSGANSVSPYYRWARMTYRFAQGVATGNLSEVGVGWTGSPTYLLFSHALILDGIGNPTTITILADETLDVLYEYRIYPKETDSTGTTIFTGNIGGTYDWIIRLANAATAASNNYYPYMGVMAPMNYGFEGSPGGTLGVGSTPQNIAAITTMPAGLVANSAVGVPTAYVTGDRFIIFTFTFGLNQANHVGGIRCLKTSLGPMQLQIQFDPAIPKTLNDIVTITFKHTWNRV